jgi:tripartite-type tricarboxylate transporter receptor subunit TctC
MTNLTEREFHTRRRMVVGGGAAALLTAMPRLGFSQEAYPNRPIRLIVPSAAGGAPDLICRILTNELSQALGQGIVVDNRPGAGGAIGMQEVAKALPDGYTLGYANVVTLAINRSLYKKLPYDPDSFSPIALLGTVQNALVVRKDLPVSTVKELVEYAKSKPAGLMMASAGNGTTSHLGGELFKSLTNIFALHIPYRGSPSAVQDLLGGNVDFMFDNLSSIGQHIKSGRVRALGVSGSRRSELFPRIPTIQEAGVAGYETTAWGGIVGPRGLPASIVTRLNTEINKILTNPAIREKYSQMAFETMASPPNLLMTMAKLETPRWAEVVKRSGATVDQ